MELYSSGDSYKLYKGDMRDMLEVIEPNTIDSIITDPPYELNFMNKGWDNSGIAFQKDTWEKCYEVLKPGGYLLAFGGSRTFHRIACAIEDAGFEIRDTIMWLYGSGFPKSMDISKSLDKRNGRTSNEFVEFGKYLKEKRGNISQTEISKLFPSKNGGITGRVSNWENGLELPNKEQYIKLKSILYLGDKYDYLIEKEQAKREIIGKGKAGLTKGTIANFVGNTEFDITIPSTDLAKQWQGWGTALKPSFEPIIVARKPFKGSLVDNVIQYGVGGINIDECRVEPTGEDTGRNNTGCKNSPLNSKDGWNKNSMVGIDTTGRYEGRFPANTILTYDETDFEEVCGGFPQSKGQAHIRNNTIGKYDFFTEKNGKIYNANTETGYTDSGSASRYFYCAKASKKDRDEGLDEFETKKTGELQGGRKDGSAGSIMQNANGGTRVNPYAGAGIPKKNVHPTVKPTELMQYLVRLVTPNGGIILDPFNGSGSTGKAVMYENKERNKNYKYIGIELTEEYLPISKARIEYVCNLTKEELKEKQMTIFDLEDRQ